MGDDAKVILLPESLHPTFIGDFIVPAVALSIGLRSRGKWSSQLQKVWLMQKLKLFKRSKDIRLLTWRPWNRFSISSTLGL